MFTRFPERLCRRSVIRLLPLGYPIAAPRQPELPRLYVLRLKVANMIRWLKPFLLILRPKEVSCRFLNLVMTNSKQRKTKLNNLISSVLLFSVYFCISSASIKRLLYLWAHLARRAFFHCERFRLHACPRQSEQVDTSEYYYTS